jgi:hypothetical protein
VTLYTLSGDDLSHLADVEGVDAAFLVVLGIEALARRLVHRSTADEVEELTAD